MVLGTTGALAQRITLGMPGYGGTGGTAVAVAVKPGLKKAGLQHADGGTLLAQLDDVCGHPTASVRGCKAFRRLMISRRGH
jgi:hypothetical protein